MGVGTFRLDRQEDTHRHAIMDAIKSGCNVIDTRYERKEVSREVSEERYEGEAELYGNDSDVEREFVCVCVRERNIRKREGE